MSISVKQKSAWLLLVFTLPTAKASERVGVWRKLQRYGALALPASGYVLPNNSMNQERFEWLATSIRSSKGQAAVAQVNSFDDLRNEQIEQMFNEARTREYKLLEQELKKLAKTPNHAKSEPGIVRVKRRLQQIVEIDFFGAPLRVRIEEAMHQLEGDTTTIKSRQAKFAFDKDPRRHPDAIPFDMFNAGGFGHVGNDCTFETLVKSFGIKDSRLRLVAQAIHEADLADEHFGRTEALGIDRILDGWNKQGVANEEVLRRGMEMIEGLYNGIR